jgi:hypothetical protein
MLTNTLPVTLLAAWLGASLGSGHVVWRQVVQVAARLDKGASDEMAFAVVLAPNDAIVVAASVDVAGHVPWR